MSNYRRIVAAIAATIAFSLGVAAPASAANHAQARASYAQANGV